MKFALYQLSGTAANRHHRGDGSDSDHNTQHSQSRAHLVTCKCVNGDRDGQEEAHVPLVLLCLQAGDDFIARFELTADDFAVLVVTDANMDFPGPQLFTVENPDVSFGSQLS